jgi:uncharacterized membrane protein HdeD (DUF308 family)
MVCATAEALGAICEFDLSVVMLLLSVFALGDVATVTLIITIFISAMLLVGGVFQAIHAFMAKTWSGFLMNMLRGIVYAVGGLLIMGEPVKGAVVITRFLIGALAVSGAALRILVALRHREMGRWWLIALSGLISIVIGVLLYTSLAWSGLWVLGTLIDVELLVQGMTWLMFGMALPRMRHSI